MSPDDQDEALLFVPAAVHGVSIAGRDHRLIDPDEIQDVPSGEASEIKTWIYIVRRPRSASHR